MERRKPGFLWEDEHRYIRGDGDVDDRRVKSRLKTDSADAAAVGAALHEFRSELELVERFWRDRLAERSGRYHWEDIILPANEDEIRRLRDLLDEWLEHAQTDFVEREDEVLRTHLAPLWADLDLKENDEPMGVLFGSPERDRSHENEITRELRARYDSLVMLLQEPQLREILTWVLANPQNKIPKNREYKQNTWRWAASRRLGHDYGVVTESKTWDHVFTPTDRGQAVHATLQELATSDADAVANLSEDDRLRKWLQFLQRRNI